MNKNCFDKRLMSYGIAENEEEVKNCCNCEFGDSNVDEPPCSECHSNDIKWEREVE